MKDITPEVTVITCDCCGRTDSETDFKKAAVLALKRHALDILGIPRADASITIDLCDNCEFLVSQALNDVKLQQTLTNDTID